MCVFLRFFLQVKLLQTLQYGTEPADVEENMPASSSASATASSSSSASSSSLASSPSAASDEVNVWGWGDHSSSSSSSSSSLQYTSSEKLLLTRTRDLQSQVTKLKVPIPLLCFFLLFSLISSASRELMGLLTSSVVSVTPEHLTSYRSYALCIEFWIFIRLHWQILRNKRRT